MRSERIITQLLLCENKVLYHIGQYQSRVLRRNYSALRNHKIIVRLLDSIVYVLFWNNR